MTLNVRMKTVKQRTCEKCGHFLRSTEIELCDTCRFIDRVKTDKDFEKAVTRAWYKTTSYYTFINIPFEDMFNIKSYDDLSDRLERGQDFTVIDFEPHSIISDKSAEIEFKCLVGVKC